MEPLFENHFTVDERVLLEWHKKEFYRDNRFYVGMNAGLIVVYLGLAALVLVNGWLLPAWLAVAAVALFLFLAAVFLANLLLRYRLQVRQFLKSEEGVRFPGHSGTVFYEGFVMFIGEKSDQNPAGRMMVCAARASVLRQEFGDVMGQPTNWAGEDVKQTDALRARLVLLQKQLEDLSAEAKAAVGRQYDYSALTDYVQTCRLHVLHFGETTVLVSKNGFTRGDNDSFGAFVAAKLRAAAMVSRDEKLRRKLEKALARYFPVISTTEGGQAHIGG